VSQINGTDRQQVYEQLLAVAKKKTAEADVKLDESGKPIEQDEPMDLGDNVIIVPPSVPGVDTTSAPAGDETGDEEQSLADSDNDADESVPIRRRKKKATKKRRRS
jgi:DNA topoisomerase-6 subunit B